jgi:diaminopimelate epimerase
MCGNAARCATLYFNQRVEPKGTVQFLTGAGAVEGKILTSDRVQIEMPPVLEIKAMTVYGIPGVFTHTGVPHFVLEQAPNADIAKKLRTVSDFGPSGANITFVEVLKENLLAAVTFERGVEGFTQACGTGAVAAAVYVQNKLGSQSFVTVRMPGGELKIEGGQVKQRPYLTGPVQFEFDLSHWSYDEKF